MDKDIRQRFLQVDDIETLVDSFSCGEESLTLFESSWALLHADLSRCLSTGELSDDTISLANMVTSKVATVADYFSGSHKILQNQLDEVESILDRLNHVAISPSMLAAQSPGSSSPSSSFIELAYKWLLANIHNPYPSPAMKASIAGSSGSSMNSISAWFISARRRIGWTTICRKHFNNRRADTLDAAHRALVKEDPTRVLPHSIFHDFIQMKATAQDLYASTFTKSALADELDVVVKNITEEDRLQIEREKQVHAQEEKEIRRKQKVLEERARMTHAVFTSYPSPSHSRSSSPVSTLEGSWTYGSEDDEDDVNPPVLIGRKRRASISVEPTDSRRSPCVDRPMKRLRSSPKIFESHVETPALPSPASTTDGLDDGDEIASVAPPCPSTLPSPSTCSRKRRLSDTGSYSAIKRPRGILTGPRLNVVSDPLPRSSILCEPGIDDWLHTNFFEIPPPVESVGFDQSMPLDIELFSEYTFSDTRDNSLPTSIDVPPFEQLVDLGVSSHNSLATPLVFDNLDLFLASFAPNNNSCMQVATPTVTATIPHPSANPIDHIYSGSYSWTDLLNPDQSLPTMDQFSQSPSCGDLSQILPEIGFSVLPSPPLLSTIPQPETSPVDNARQAKLEQLQLLREQARLLEHDLAVTV